MHPDDAAAPPEPQPPAPSPQPLAVAVASARWADLPAVARLQERAFRPGLAYRLTTLALLRLWPGARFLVARRGGEVVGCAIGDRHDGEARVVNLAVDPSVRRQGIGSALLAALEEALPGGDLILMVETDNPGARALYERSGYRFAGDAMNYYGRGRHGVWMRKARPPTGTRPPKLRV
jgi:ribosomal-protein-alanine N-acetyltransferase